MLKRIPEAAFSVLLSTSAAAQDAAQLQNLAAAMEQAQREAVRPGDERLDCSALEQQLVEAVKSPVMQEHIEKAGAQAEKDRARLKPDPTQITAQAALTLFSSIVPGGAWAGVMAGAAQMPSQQMQTAQNVQQRIQQANEMVKILPQLMRGQRVIELAQARKCEWAPPA